ncbi:hypothetical protein H7J77_05020 [Mycolicibacillus parakoreensis]|uniref:Low molecular weight antigen MTB12-like C-terminal domain-containing protein n=2 Tax=Mycobacteriaceae TaxID=1762 RepID=A0ABY3U704_9MYCO|nr:hypothetical protein [Mycolicibacillus parakoreensis]MCV7314900.1 hypothetical protein [Mycolicibacillus parakoreensis]ULN53892.1 hypothetical protein MIU77_06245 [Mycolicibacillus parakoreensis]
MPTKKIFATGVTAVAVLGTAGLAATTVAESPAPAVHPVVFDTPLPLDPPPTPAPAPAADLPTAETLTGLLDNLVDPQTSDELKSDLVAGGLQRHQANVLDHKLRQAGRRGELPLTFTADNIQSTGENTVSSDVTVTGPKIPSPIEKNVTFVNENGWMLSQDTADELVEAIVGRLPN